MADVVESNDMVCEIVSNGFLNPERAAAK